MPRFSVQRHYAAMQPLIALSQGIHTAGRLEPALIELVVVAINSFNRINVAARTIGGHYKPGAL